MVSGLGYLVIYRQQKVQQGVPDYDPQAAALHTPPLATHLHRTAVGRA
jgi:hypothetical protein